MDSDFNKLWKPNKRQEEFLSLPDDIFEALYGGVVSGGSALTAKTTVPPSIENFLYGFV